MLRYLRALYDTRKQVSTVLRYMYIIMFRIIIISLTRGDSHLRHQSTKKPVTTLTLYIGRAERACTFIIPTTKNVGSQGWV